jgi:hypothetical protein
LPACKGPLRIRRVTGRRPTKSLLLNDIARCAL